MAMAFYLAVSKYKRDSEKGTDFRELKGTPYVGFTLELSRDNEFCVVNLEGLDCVTFFEDSLCLARMLKKGRDMKVTLEPEISTCLNWSPKLTGAMFARPLGVTA